MLTREEDFERAAERFRERVGIIHCVFVDGLTLLQKLKRYYGVGHLGVSSLAPNSEGQFDAREKIIGNGPIHLDQPEVRTLRCGGP